MKDLLRLDGKVALVTGASSGLGRHFAEVLALHGAKVAVSARRLDRLTALVADVAAKGGRAHAVRHDVTDLKGIAPMLDDIEGELGPVDILVNNAGLSVQKPLLNFAEAEYDLVFNTNLKAAFFMAQAVAARMIARKSLGRIINIASITAERVVRQIGIYGASKAGLLQLTKSMALEWARYGINVNALLPGYIETEINAEYFKTEKGKKLIEGLPRRRIGRPEDLDGALLLLASGASAFITGSSIAADDAQGFTVF